MTTYKFSLVATTCICLLALSACRQIQPAANPQAADNHIKVDAAKPSQPAPAAGTGAAKLSAADGKQATVLGAAKPALPPQVHLNLADLPDNLVICTIGKSPITINQYRTALKVQQVAVQTQLESDPQARANALATAKKLNISLTDDERKRLVEAAKQAHGGSFEQFLKSKQMSEADFTSAVADEGAEFKVAEAQIEQDLLGQLVRRAILANCAGTDGKLKEANNSVAKIEGSDEFKSLQAHTGLSKDSLHDEMLQTELARLQLNKIVDSIKVSDQEVNEFYNAHKSALKHGERVRLSSILVAAPDKDMGAVKSVRSQVQQAQPKLSGKALDAAVQNVLTAQENKALILLTEARVPKADFGKLANQNTQDGLAHMRQNGGDMGWSEKSKLVPAFVDAVWSLKPGEVVPKLVKTDEGFRIIKVTGKEKAGTVAQAELKPIIIAQLKQDKAAAVIQAWLDKQQANTPVKFSDRFLAIAKQKSPTQ